VNWTLEVFTPDGATLKATYTEAAPGGITGSFKLTVEGSGNCKQFTFTGRPSALAIGPRDIIKFSADGVDLFYGYASIAWPQFDKAEREYVILGAARLLDARLMDDDTYTDQDVAAIVRDIVQRLKHPAIKYDSSRVPDAGANVTLLSSDLVPLSRVIDDLAKTLGGGVKWGVDATGTFFFEKPSSSITEYYEALNHRWLPVVAEDAATAVDLLMAIAPRPADGRAYSWVTGVNLREESELPKRFYIHRYTWPDHAKYGIEKAYQWGVQEPQKKKVDGLIASGTVTNPDVDLRFWGWRHLRRQTAVFGRHDV